MPVLRFFGLQAAIGFIAATVFLGGVFLADPGGVATLLRAPEAGVLPVAMLWVFTGLTFGGAQFAMAVGLAAADTGSDRGSRSALPWAMRRPAPRPAYAVVRVRSRPR